MAQVYSLPVNKQSGSERMTPFYIIMYNLVSLTTKSS